ncbi:MAG TPA: hypothetical protein CFH79_06860 [Sulfurospirillum sp. UBA11407]|jgi:hypothetical protein|nr:MAG TPA: hypothetical protein CFH79_06860 [Sulfurospirillum sp. UBA11407]DAB33478.1 MAG TPA: hypothetical protein CFH82_10345 [Sulfurospirillum sp. UBA12182]
MGNVVLEKLNHYKSFRYDTKTKSIVNLKSSEEIDIDEFLEIQHLLDVHRVSYRFEPKFIIRIL